ncbi:cytochrome P450 [Nocardia cyriacigeorgica]|uniref:cytochrome P450 n=1 Tax=Nocardia cyriacigeorgica TaxID=135487 RepID=UPI0024586CAE|nr:cytochrome P450 [Nocardia cyriacigeorgica]
MTGRLDYGYTVHVAIFVDYMPAIHSDIRTVIDSLCNGLESGGHQVTLFVAAGPEERTTAHVVPLETIGRFAVKHIPIVLPTKRNADLIDNAFAARGPIDLVHTHTVHGVAIAGARAARRHRIPLVHTVHASGDTPIEHFAAVPYPATLVLQALFGRSAHRRRRNPAPTEKRAVRHAWRVLVEHAQEADQVIAPTRRVVDRLLAHGVARAVEIAPRGTGDELPGDCMSTADPSPSAIAEAIEKFACDRTALDEIRNAAATHRAAVRYAERMLHTYRQVTARDAGSPEQQMPQSLSEVPVAPGGWPLVGHSLRALRDARGFVTALSDLGPVVRVRFGQKSGYLLTTPDLVREVGLGAEVDREDLREAIEDLAGSSVNVLRGEEHKARRRMIGPALRQARLAVYAESAADIAERWSAGLPADGRVNLMAEANGLILDTMTATLFTADFSDDVRRRIGATVPSLLSEIIVRTALPPQVRRLRIFANRRWRREARELRAAIGGMVAEYRRRDEDFHDVVSALIRHTDERGDTLSDDHIIDDVIMMLSGGIGTTASMAGWLWHEVMRRPAIAERLYAELDSVVGGEPVRPEHLTRLPYLKQVVTETLRFWAPWVNAVTADGDIAVGGLLVPDGTAIMSSPYMIQHDRRYFANPEAFDPDRWSPERIGELDKKSNLWFGVGRRRCPGEHFGNLEIALASAALLSRWRPIPDPDYAVRALTKDFVLSPSALPVTLHPR